MKMLETLSPRERMLIYIGGALAITFAIWQFGINPVLSGKANAETKSIAAKRDLDIVTSGLSRLGAVSATPKLAFESPLIISAAQSQGLVISRTQPERDGATALWFTDANSADIYRFLDTISKTYQVDISRVQMTRSVSGKVDAQVTLAPQK
jgi:type II secretory pathway component PulM